MSEVKLETHQEALKRLNLKKGDRVRVTGRADEHERGWNNCWDSVAMDGFIDKVSVVAGTTILDNELGVPLKCENIFPYVLCFPAFVLEKIEDTTEQPTSTVSSEQPEVKPIPDYVIITANTVSDLMNQVNDYIADGYELVPTPTVFIEPTRTYLREMIYKPKIVVSGEVESDDNLLSQVKTSREQPPFNRDKDGVNAALRYLLDDKATIAAEYQVDDDAWTVTIDCPGLWGKYTHKGIVAQSSLSACIQALIKTANANLNLFVPLT